MRSDDYYDLITPYGDALKVVLTKIEILNHNIYRKDAQNPVHHVEHRIKSKHSTEEKLLRLNAPSTAEMAKDLLMDIAGIRVICYFREEIMDLVEALKAQNDLIIIREKDYISHPKPNGYQSYHLLVGVPLYCMDAMEYYPVEIQFRTLSMDLWASMEHRVRYKKNGTKKGHADNEALAQELLQYSIQLDAMEKRFREMKSGK